MKRTTEKPIKKKIVFTDETPMPWGKYQGEKLGTIRGSYFIFLYEKQLCAGPLQDYIIDNLECFKLEIKLGNEKKKYNR